MAFCGKKLQDSTLFPPRFLAASDFPFPLVQINGAVAPTPQGTGIRVPPTFTNGWVLGTPWVEEQQRALNDSLYLQSQQKWRSRRKKNPALCATRSPHTFKFVLAPLWRSAWLWLECGKLVTRGKQCESHTVILASSLEQASVTIDESWRMNFERCWASTTLRENFTVFDSRRSSSAASCSAVRSSCSQHFSSSAPRLSSNCSSSSASPCCSPCVATSSTLIANQFHFNNSIKNYKVRKTHRCFAEKKIYLFYKQLCESKNWFRTNDQVKI